MQEKGRIIKISGPLIVAENMADFQIPRNFFVVDALPRNAMGKLMKHMLSERFAIMGDRGVAECRKKH